MRRGKRVTTGGGALFDDGIPPVPALDELSGA
jgi:hypothetical protein